MNIVIVFLVKIGAKNQSGVYQCNRIGIITFLIMVRVLSTTDLKGVGYRVYIHKV